MPKQIAPCSSSPPKNSRPCHTLRQNAPLPAATTNGSLDGYSSNHAPKNPHRLTKQNAARASKLHDRGTRGAFLCHPEQVPYDRRWQTRAESVSNPAMRFPEWNLENLCLQSEDPDDSNAAYGHSDSTWQRCQVPNDNHGIGLRPTSRLGTTTRIDCALIFALLRISSVGPSLSIVRPRQPFYGMLAPQTGQL